jgi:hypothetical protein
MCRYVHHVYMKKTIKPPDEDLLSGPEVARKWCLNPATIRRWRVEGAPAHTLGQGLIRYKLSELRAWRAQRETLLKQRHEVV